VGANCLSGKGRGVKESRFVTWKSERTRLRTRLKSEARFKGQKGQNSLAPARKGERRKGRGWKDGEIKQSSCLPETNVHEKERKKKREA